MQEHTRLARARRGLERRLFLKALGLGLSAPLAWELCRSATAHAQEARPKRLMIFFTPHGMPPEHYNPIATGAGPTNFTLVGENRVNILGPLEPYKQYVNVLQGFEYPGASTHEGILTVLSNYGTSNDEVTPRTSFEHVIANGLGAQPLILGAIAHRVWGIDKDGKLMWDGQPVVPEKNPLLAFTNTFSNTASTDPQAAVKQQLREALTSLTERQLSSLGTELSSVTRAQSKLQVHLEAVQALRIGAGAGSQQSCQTVPSLPAVEALRVAAQGQPEEFFLSEDNFPALLAAQLQVAAQAIICNATPVVAVQAMYANADINFAFMGSPGSHHSALSHTGPQAQGTGLALEPRTPFANAQRWFYQQLVDHVVSRLMVPDPADPQRQVIDNTVIYAFSEIGEGAWHTSKSSAIQLGATPNAYAYMPIVTIGGGGGALRTGQLINVNPNAAGTDRPAGDIYLALCRAMGVQATAFGNATNPLTEILV